MDTLLERLAQADAALSAVRDDHPAESALKEDHDDFRAREARAEQAVSEAWHAIENRWDDLVYHVEKQNQLITTCVSNLSQTNRFASREQWEDERRFVIEDLMPEATRRLIVLTALRTGLEEMGYPEAAAIGRAPSGAGAGLELLAWDREPT